MTERAVLAERLRPKLGRRWNLRRNVQINRHIYWPDFKLTSRYVIYFQQYKAVRSGLKKLWSEFHFSHRL